MHAWLPCRPTVSFERPILQQHCRHLIKILGSLLSYPMLVATVSFNPAVAESLQTSRATSLSCIQRHKYHCLPQAYNVLSETQPSRPLKEHRIRLVLVRIRIRVPTVVFGFLFFFFSLDTSACFFNSLYSSQVCVLCLAATNVDRQSHCPGTVTLFFCKAHQLLTLTKQLFFHDNFEKKRKHKQPDNSFFAVNRWLIHLDLVHHQCAARVDEPRSAATFIATVRTGTDLLPGQMSHIAGRAYLHFIGAFNNKAALKSKQKRVNHPSALRSTV